MVPLFYCHIRTADQIDAESDQIVPAPSDTAMAVVAEAISSRLEMDDSSKNVPSGVTVSVARRPAP